MTTMLSSISTGLVATRTPAGALVVKSVLDKQEWSDPTSRYIASLVPDWRPQAEAPSSEDLAELAQLHRTSRAHSLCLNLLEGLSSALELRVIEHLESLLQEGASAKRITSLLMTAPLAAPQKPQTLAQVALSSGCAAIAKVFEDLAAAQPLLHRFCDLWLSLPVEAFSEIETSKAHIWHWLVQDGIIARTISASNNRAFGLAWNELAFHVKSPQARSAVRALGNKLQSELFPSSAAYDARPVGTTKFLGEENSIEEHWVSGGGRRGGNEKFKRALKQVNAIADAVASGKDAIADKFLRELIKNQARDDSQFAVKSLCNIAQRCGDMFRTDYERHCLEAALSIRTDDPWTLIQWGDHLKRTGQFEPALRAFKQAAALGDARVSTTSQADVFAIQGDYARAADIYRSLSDWQQDRRVRVALANILKKSGNPDAALREFQQILREWPSDLRARAGLAEVLKSTGDLPEALKEYDALFAQLRALSPAERDDRSELIYRTARCQILKLSGRFDEALNGADQIVQRAPFFMEARLLRASLLALVGKTREGLAEAREFIPNAFGEWRASYTRGLLLFKLNRYSEARNQLLSKLKSGFVKEEAPFKLVAAYAYLQAGGADLDSAAALLAGANNLDSVHLEYIRQGLELHVSTVRRDIERARELQLRLTGPARQNPLLKELMVALARREYGRALKVELSMLLQVG